MTAWRLTRYGLGFDNPCFVEKFIHGQSTLYIVGFPTQSDIERRRPEQRIRISQVEPKQHRSLITLKKFHFRYYYLDSLALSCRMISVMKYPDYYSDYYTLMDTRPHPI